MMSTAALFYGRRYFRKFAESFAASVKKSGSVVQA